MEFSYDLLVKNGTCVLATGDDQKLSEVSCSIAIKDGKIAEIGDIADNKAERILDAQGLHVLPGLIDSQVHFREPGAEHKEDLASGTASALLGGITAIFDMPNTNPSTVTALDFNDKLARAKGRAWTNYAFYMGASPENWKNLSDLEKLPGCCGTKVFMGSSTGSLLFEDDELLTEALKSLKRNVAVHSEDEHRLRERKPLLDDHIGDPSFHSEWRDETTAFNCTEKLVAAARAANKRVHILHISSKKEMLWLADQKDIMTVEVTPQHLTLQAPDCYERLGTKGQMNPPIRSIEHQEVLWQGIKNGTVDVIGSDHAPHTLDEKAQEYPKSPSGMPGVQTTVPIMLNHVNQGKLSLPHLVNLLASNPAKIFKIKNKGSIQVGFDADLTLVDMNRKEEIKASWIQSKCGWTPFEGDRVQGWPIATILNGEVKMRDAQLIGSPNGRALDFSDL